MQNESTDTSQSSEVWCPRCRFLQEEYLAITDDGVTYACENDDCRISEFYGQERWPGEDGEPESDYSAE